MNDLLFSLVLYLSPTSFSLSNGLWVSIPLNLTFRLFLSKMVYNLFCAPNFIILFVIT